MIKIENLKKRFGSRLAVDDLSLEIEEGESFALLGPNGSGKTTTFKCLAGLTVPSAGRVLIHGRDVWKEGKETRHLLSYLPQRLSFHDSLTAREVLTFFCRLRKLDPGRVAAVLAESRFDFNGFADRPAGEFSGGMIQRLGLAVACLPDAPILVLDEPTVGLDPQGVIRFREFLRSLKREGKTILFSSHMLADVEQFADRVAILVGGELVALERVGNLSAGAQRSSKMRLQLNNPDPRWKGVARAAGASEVCSDGDCLIISSPPEVQFQILQAVETAGGKIARFVTVEPSLEDIYMRYLS
jgi:ABC-type multidrug transport system ATPase subunit